MTHLGVGLRTLEDLLAAPGPAAVLTACRELRSVLLPAECVVCGKPEDSLCPPCRMAVRHTTLRPFDASAGAAMLPSAEQNSPAWTGSGAGSRTPETAELPALRVTAAGRYGGGLARVVLACKNHGHTDLSALLAEAMARSLREAARTAGAWNLPLMVVPVPGSFRGRTRRGYDPLQLILAKVRRRGLLPAGTEIGNVLKYRRRTAAAGLVLPGAQKSLGAGARRRNVHGTMTAGAPGTLGGVHVLVADDVLTTGATLAEAVRALRAAGAQVFSAAVIAAVRAPSGDPAGNPPRP